MASNTLLEALNKFGLSQNEALVWLCLLEFNNRSTSWIAKKLKLNRGTTYLVLLELIEKGLVTQIHKGNKSVFIASKPDDLAQILKKEEEEIKRKQQTFVTILPFLNQIQSGKEFDGPGIEHYSGVEGARKVLYESIQAKDSLFRVYISLFDIIDYVGEDFFHEFARERVKRGYTAHLIRLQEKDQRAQQTFKGVNYGPSVEQRRYIKYLNKSFNYPTTISIFDDKVGIISSKDEDLSMIIHSSELSTFQRQIFDMLWNSPLLETAG
jgi:sugar-specific transcriptional regulator TrmB